MALEHESDSALAKAIRAAGSQSAFGRLLRRKDGQPVRQSTVRGWLLAEELPPEHVLAVEAATGISRHELRPDIYPIEQPISPSPVGTGQLEIAK